MDLRTALDHLLRLGIGPFVAANNPRLYMFVPYALALVALGDLYALVRNARRLIAQFSSVATALGAIIGILLSLALPFLGVYGIWWSFLPSATIVPWFSPPATSDTWAFGIPARATYEVLGAWVHGLIFYFSLLYFAFLLVYPLALRVVRFIRRGARKDDAEGVGSLMIWASILLTLSVWELAGWPVAVTVPAELATAYYLPTAIVNIAKRRTDDDVNLRTPEQLRRVVSAERLVDWVLTLVALTLIMITHAIDWYPLAFFGLYFSATCIDPIVNSLHGMFVPKDLEAAYSRWKFTLPVILIMTWLGAAGVLHQVVVWLAGIGLTQISASNPGYPPALWVEVGAAAAAYALFFPLTDLAEEVIYKREKQQGIRVELPAWVPIALGYFNPLIQIAQLALRENERRQLTHSDLMLSEVVVESTLVILPGSGDDPSSAASASATTADQPHKGGTPSETKSVIEEQVPLSSAPTSPSPAQRLLGTPAMEQHGFRLFQFHAMTIFLVTAVIYHYFLLGPISSVLNNGLGLLVFSLLPLLAGLLPLLNRRTYDPPMYVMILLIYIILVITGVDALLVFANVSLTLPPSSTAADVALGSAQFGGAVARRMAQEMLVLVTVGETLYLFLVVQAILVLDQREANFYDGGDRIAFALRWMRLGEYARAVEVFDSVLAHNPRNQDALREKCIALYQLRRYQEALSTCDDLLRVAPPSGRLFNLRGDILARMSRYEEAFVAYRRAVDASPNVAVYWSDLASTLTALSRYAEAYDAYLRAITLDPDQVAYRVDVALILTSLGRFNEALSAYSSALKALGAGDPTNRARILRNAAAILTEDLDQHDEALKVIEQALELEPKSVRAWVIKGHALKMLGKDGEAEEAFAQALSLRPATSWDTDVLSLQANAYRELGRYDEALARIDLAIAIKPGVRSYHQGRGDILMQMGQYAEAISAYDRALAPANQEENSNFSVDYYDALRAKAKALRALGREDESIEVERRMAKLRDRHEQ